MYNLTDGSAVILQTIKYKGIELELNNRNFISSDKLPLGYKKEIVEYVELDRIFREKTLIGNKRKIAYKMSWELFLEEEDYLTLCSIYSSYYNDVLDEIDYSNNLYMPPLDIVSTIILVDNRIKDVYENRYKSYNIVIDKLDFIEEFFFANKLMKVNMEASTI